jgi:predicted methyltransferase
MRRFLIFVAASFGLVASPLPVAAAAEPADAELCEGCEALIELALAHPRRSGDKARDQFRHPADTLKFFRVKPGMTVVDYMPSGGWYTRILVPYLGKDGNYIGLNPDPGDNERFATYVGGLREKFPAMAAKWNLEGASVEAYNADELTEEMNGTVDRVLIFREMHNLHRNGILHNELNRLRDLLKDGGMLGIVQHRAKPWAPADYVTGNRGYLRQQDVIGLVEAHGFDLVATSEVNANPRDTADHPAGVWELPPVQRTKREELKAVGESDRMTLLFRKRS